MNKLLHLHSMHARTLITAVHCLLSVRTYEDLLRFQSYPFHFKVLYCSQETGFAMTKELKLCLRFFNASLFGLLGDRWLFPTCAESSLPVEIPRISCEMKLSKSAFVLSLWCCIFAYLISQSLNVHQSAS